MAVLFITEYRKLAIEGSGTSVLVGQEPGNDQTVAIAAGSTQSAALSLATKFVRVHTDAICHILFGANPTATTGNKRLAAGQTEFFGAVGGHIIAVIAGV